MFGLMKNTGCMKAEQHDWYRMHYCGTCKAIGSQYGQRSRMLLNFDCVFLAEMLSVIQEDETDQWDASLSSHQCFSMPQEDRIPLSLQFAADVNLLLAEMKVQDNLQDEVKMVWKTAQRFFRKPFGKLKEQLQKWEIDQHFLVDLQAEHSLRESQPPTTSDIRKLLAWYAAPTATITGYLFGKGGELVQQTDWKETMSGIGYAFGELVYGLDAWNDVEKDEEEEAFNLLLLNSDKSIEDKKQLAADWLWEKADSIQQLINEAPFPAEVKTSLNSRLVLNLAAKLGEKKHVCTPQSGIEKATVPRIARTMGIVQHGIWAWTNPLKPVRFAATYIVGLLLVFHQQLFAAADYGAEASMSLDFGLIGGLIGAPIGMYLLARGISKNREWFARKLEAQPKRIKRWLRRAERKATKKDGKLKWWAWLLIIIGGLFALLLLLLILLLVSAVSNCGSSDCGDCNCNCGDCGDCGDCDCNC